LAGPNARAHQQDCRQNGKAEQRQRRRQRRKFLVIEVEQRRNRLRYAQISGRSGFRKGGQSGGERNRAVARQ
jgi:hypothetical protein